MTRGSNKKKCVIFGLLALTLYIFIAPTKYTAKFDGELQTTHPSVAWEYLADFNNIKKLNPTILNFSIISDHGNFEHWVYDVHYTEFLSNFPFIYNAATARYQVYRVAASTMQKEKYVVESTHKTCFALNLLCLNSWSTFICTEREKYLNGAYCIEEVVYECPKLMSMLCHSEVMHQRKEIFKNLLKNLR